MTVRSENPSPPIVPEATDLGRLNGRVSGRESVVIERDVYGTTARILEYQQKLSMEGREAEDLAYTSPIWARLSLPHRNPGDAQFWSTTNGGVSLVVDRATVLGKDGQLERGPLPYGAVPRHLLTYLATEAMRTQSPEIDLGGSLRGFMSRIGMPYAGNRAGFIQEQVRAITTCRVSLQRHGALDDEWGVQLRNLVLAKDMNLWLGGGEQTGLWGSDVTLSDEFFRSIVEAHGAMPLFYGDLRVLGDSSLRIDIYLWLVYRLHAINRRKPVGVSWHQLHQQFGSTYKVLRQFKARFLEALTDVLHVYEDARVEISPDGKALLLYQSPARVGSGVREQLTRRSKR